MQPPHCRAWLRIFVVRYSLPCDPPVGGHSCNGGIIPRFHPLGVRGGKAQNERMFSGLPPKADLPPDLRTTPVASSWRTPPSRPRDEAEILCSTRALPFLNPYQTCS